MVPPKQCLHWSGSGGLSSKLSLAGRGLREVQAC